MKKLFLFIGLFLGISAVYAQDLLPSQVPSLILNSFNRSFPDARDVDWEKEGKLYQVEFERQRRDHDVWLDEKGKIVRQKQDINPRALPQEVKRAVKTKYGNARIDDAEKIIDGNQTRYKIEVDTRDGDREFYMDQKGQEINKRK